MATFKYIKKPRTFKSGMSNVLLTCSRTENSADFVPRSLRFNRIPSENLIFNQLDVEMTDYITFWFFV